MDRVDVEILKCLKKNARMKASAIGDEINLSVSAVTERIKKLESNGIIQQYTTVLDHKMMGYDVVAIMEVSLDHPQYYDAFSQMVELNPNIVDCYYIAGDYDFVLKIVTDSSQSLEGLHRSIKSFEGVSSTKTYFVLKTQKSEVTVLPRSSD